QALRHGGRGGAARGAAGARQQLRDRPDDRARRRLVTRRLGALALVIWAAQVASHFARREPWDNLWLCNMGALLIALGALAPAALPLAIGVCWLGSGTLFWLIALTGGAELVPVSILLHLGVLPIGCVAAVRV